MKELEDKVDTMRADIKIIKNALIGDEFNPNGLIKRTDKNEKAITKLENGKIKERAYVAGASSVLAAFGAWLSKYL